jgi:hypothetical protein
MVFAKRQVGVFSDTTFLYSGESISAGGARELILNQTRVPLTMPPESKAPAG